MQIRDTQASELCRQDAMQVSRLTQDTRLQILQAISLQINIARLPVNPSLSPILDAEVALILGVHQCDVAFLYEKNILERTCQWCDQAEQPVSACTYWDLFNATACMSLLAIGYSNEEAGQIAFCIFDGVAELSENNGSIPSINFGMLTAMVEQILRASDCCPRPHHMSHPSELIAKKIAIDLLTMHHRCVELTSACPTRLM
jgi:hypothetical protein